MPLVTLPPISRRAFSLAMAGAGASLLRSAAPEPFWALLSDTHISADPANSNRGFKPYDNLKRVVPQVAAANCDGALICGDVAREEGLSGDYQNVKSLLAPVMEKMPVTFALGNHDDRRNFLDVFGTAQVGVQPVKQKHVVVIETPVARLVALDSLQQVHVVAGLLGKAQRTWLAAYLKESATLPVVLFVHHTLDDADGSLLDAPRFFDLLKPHRHVKAIVYGHSHRRAFETWEGVHLVNLPALGYNFNDAEPVGWTEMRLSREGASFTLRAIGGNTDKNGDTVNLRWRV